MQEYLVCLIPKYSAQNITSNLAICFWNIADYFGIPVILQAIFNRILIGIRGFSCSDLTNIHIHALADNKNLCPVEHLTQYLDKTSVIRGLHTRLLLP